MGVTPSVSNLTSVVRKEVVMAAVFSSGNGLSLLSVDEEHIILLLDHVFWAETALVHRDRIVLCSAIRPTIRSYRVGWLLASCSGNLTLGKDRKFHYNLLKKERRGYVIRQLKTVT